MLLQGNVKLIHRWRMVDNRSWEMAVFVTVADTQGFSSAGRRLGLTPSAVSKLIGRLEDRLGTSLLMRSTRGMNLTIEGAAYLDRARKILADLEDADRQASGDVTATPRGKLIVSASVGFGECVLLPILPRFLERYPDVEIDLSLSDVKIDLMYDSIDIAIRSGALDDSGLMARKILESSAVIVGSPEYLSQHGTPYRPEDLQLHNCLGFNFRRDTDEWPFRHPQTHEEFVQRVNGNVKGNNGAILRQLALDGLGLIRVGRFHVADDIRRGVLIPVLDDFLPPLQEEIHAIFVGHEHLAARVRAFIDFLVETVWLQNK